MSDDRLLAFEVETALKALGIAAGGNESTVMDLRSAVEDLRGSRPLVLPLPSGPGLAPALQPDDAVFGLR